MWGCSTLYSIVRAAMAFEVDVCLMVMCRFEVDMFWAVMVVALKFGCDIVEVTMAEMFEDGMY